MIHLETKDVLMATIALAEQLAITLDSYRLTDSQGEEVVSLLLQALRSRRNMGSHLPIKSNGQDF